MTQDEKDRCDYMDMEVEVLSKRIYDIVTGLKPNWDMTLVALAALANTAAMAVLSCPPETRDEVIKFFTDCMKHHLDGYLEEYE